MHKPQLEQLTKEVIKLRKPVKMDWHKVRKCPVFFVLKLSNIALWAIEKQKIQKSKKKKNPLSMIYDIMFLGSGAFSLSASKWQ